MDKLPIFDSSGTPVSLKDSPAKVKAFYFSAHWCGPCRQFTPKLLNFYNTVNKDKKTIEIVFVSSDKDAASYKEYYKEMPWLTIDYKYQKETNALKKKYKILGIPSLVIVDEEGDVLDRNGVGELRAAEEDDYQELVEKWASTGLSVYIVGAAIGIAVGLGILIYFQRKGRKAKM